MLRVHLVVAATLLGPQHCRIMNHRHHHHHLTRTVRQTTDIINIDNQVF